MKAGEKLGVHVRNTRSELDPKEDVGSSAFFFLLLFFRIQSSGHNIGSSAVVSPKESSSNFESSTNEDSEAKS